MGAAIRVENSNLEVSNSLFEGNKATLEGGALMFSCSVNFAQVCDFKISKSIFKENSAKKGGAISFDLFQPQLD